MAPQYDNLSDILLGGEQVAVERQMIIKPKFDLPPAYASQFGDVIAGSEAKYIAPEGDRPSGYLVREVKRPANVDSRPSIALADGSPFVVTRMNATWLKPNEVFCRQRSSARLTSLWRTMARLRFDLRAGP